MIPISKNEQGQYTIPPILYIDSFRKNYDQFHQEIFGNEALIAFTQGYCWHFALLLQKAYPDGELYLTQNKQHVLCKINDVFYDIRGIIEEESEIFVKPTQEDIAYMDIKFSKGTNGEYNDEINNILDQLGEEAVIQFKRDYCPVSHSR